MQTFSARAQGAQHATHTHLLLPMDLGLMLRTCTHARTRTHAHS